MDLYRGIDAEGNNVLFLDGQLGDDPGLSMQDVADAVVKFGGDEFGEPAPGTSATLIAKLDLGLEIVPFDGVATATIAPLEKAEEKPEIEPDKEMVAFNKSLLKRGVAWFAKASEDKEQPDEGLAIGIVLEPNDDEDGQDMNPDTQGEVFSKRVVRDTAYDWLAKGGAIDFMHSFKELNDTVVEVVGCDTTHGPVTLGEGDKSYEPRVGTWLLTTRWDTSSEYWKGIKAGNYQAYSPGGLARKAPVEGSANA